MISSAKLNNLDKDSGSTLWLNGQAIRNKLKVYGI